MNQELQDQKEMAKVYSSAKVKNNSSEQRLAAEQMQMGREERGVVLGVK